MKQREERYRAIIEAKASKYGINPAILMAVVAAESSFIADAKNPADPSYGLMQITPILAQDYGIVKNWKSPTPLEITNMLDPCVNVEVGAWYLSKLLGKYPFEAAIQMYNLGETGYKKGNRNKKYLERVRKFYEGYSKKS